MKKVSIEKFTAPIESKGMTAKSGRGSKSDCAFGVRSYGSGAAKRKVPKGPIFGKAKVVEQR